MFMKLVEKSKPIIPDIARKLFSFFYFERRSAGRNQFITEMRDLKIANIRKTEKGNINILFMKGNNN